MKTLLIINDNSSEARRAAEFALLVAQKVQANIMLMNTSVILRKIKEKVPAGYISKTDMEEQSFSDMFYHLKKLSQEQGSFIPEIEEFDSSKMNENDLIELVNRNHIWMMIKGMPEIMPAAAKKTLNIHAVLNRVLCPLLLIPAQWQLKDIERLAYIADLRYCRIQVVRFLAVLARPWQAALSIAHMSANGLPDMAEKYALTVFSEEVSQNVNYDNLFFNNIREKDLSKVVDVMINTMHNDILVMVNHRFHFEEIVGRYITDTLPPQITVPLLIFPC
jgi:hypothetical protein